MTRLRTDPQGFLDAVPTPAILDEVQNVPEVFAYVRTRIDDQPRRAGQWLLTGSQEAPLMQGVTESMAGRAAVLQLLPLSWRETPKVGLLRGGYPEVLARPSAARLWFGSYLQTYLERDVRAVTAVRDLALFRRFLALLASRHGQVLNKTDLAAPLGVSVPTIAQWLGVLETTAQILIVPPFYENLGKRLIKSPKIYIADAGLACHRWEKSERRLAERACSSSTNHGRQERPPRPSLPGFGRSVGRRLSRACDVHVLADPPQGWSGEHGRIDAELLGRHLPPPYAQHEYFICGPNPMLDAVEAALGKLGVPLAKYHSERDSFA